MILANTIDDMVNTLGCHLDDALHEVFLGYGVPAADHLLQDPRQHQAAGEGAGCRQFREFG